MFLALSTTVDRAVMTRDIRQNAGNVRGETVVSPLEITFFYFYFHSLVLRAVIIAQTVRTLWFRSIIAGSRARARMSFVG